MVAVFGHAGDRRCPGASARATLQSGSNVEHGNQRTKQPSRSLPEAAVHDATLLPGGNAAFCDGLTSVN
ncbi:MAG: hypothetical protein C4345_01335, partial [Chloroflexota bacterium]